MSFLGVLRISLSALWNNKGRNLLTMSGVTIGVFALTMIIALGQGLSAMITDTVSSDDNLRQIRLMGGTGVDLTKPDEIEITGEMSAERRMRLRRAALNRQQGRRSIGRRVTTITDETISELSKLEHVQSVRPIVTERYRVTVGQHDTEAVVSFGVDVNRERYRDRVMTGEYFSANDADEVILHEYLLYQWGLIQPEDQQSLIGKTLTLATLGNDKPSMESPGINPLFAQFADDLSAEEQDALQVLLPKLIERFAGNQRERQATIRDLTIVGILREMEPGEPFNMLEDTNSTQADIFLPHETAREMFLASTVNSELGYSTALVIVDDAAHAADVEQTLRDRGYTAFSIAGVLEQIETSLSIVTVVVAFLTGIALIVSALGIVNTMITSVLERTREIGIYKAVGAADQQVMAMFLTESALIGFCGGLLGLTLAILATYPGDVIADAWIANRAAVTLQGSVFVMPLWLQVGGPLLGTATAVIAALIPARRAARVDPVTALRHD